MVYFGKQERISNITLTWHHVMAKTKHRQRQPYRQRQIWYLHQKNSTQVVRKNFPSKLSTNNFPLKTFHPKFRTKIFHPKFSTKIFHQNFSIHNFSLKTSLHQKLPTSRYIDGLLHLVWSIIGANGHLWDIFQ